MARTENPLPPEVASILDELEEQRRRFLTELSYPDLFGAAYWHVTRREAAALDAGERRFPDERVHEIRAFYAAWRENDDAARAGRPVATHWRRYFALADAMRHRRRPFLAFDRGEQLARLLRHGVEAHIAGDLPGALVAVFGASPVTPADLWPDFLAMDPLFSRAMRDTLGDIDRATGREWSALRSTRRPLWELGVWLLGRFGDGDAWLRRLRRRAWQEAVRRDGQPHADPACRVGHARSATPHPPLRRADRSR